MKLISLLLCLAFSASSASAEGYVPAPLKLLTERVDEHDQQICELQERIEKLEAKASQLVSKPDPVVKPAKAFVGRRLKTAAEISRDIAGSRDGRIYARMAMGQNHLVYRHLVSEHGYQPSQVNGLSLGDALQLHNVAHGPRISGYIISGSAKQVDVFVPTPRRPTQPRPTPTPTGNRNCANGQCARSGSASTASGWFPGKILFGR